MIDKRWKEVRKAIKVLEKLGWRVSIAAVVSDCIEGTHVDLRIEYKPPRKRDVL